MIAGSHESGKPTLRGAARPLRLLLALALLVAATPSPAQRSSLERLNHLIVLYMENWSFDGLFGRFPGANGIANAGAAARQVDRNGRPYAQLPQPILIDDLGGHPPAPDARFPHSLAPRPFDLAAYVPPQQLPGDLVHRYYQAITQIDGGRMDRYVSAGNSGGLPMSYYDLTPTYLGQLARRYTLCDRFFHSAFGGSWLNHIWLVAAQQPRWTGAPATMVARLDSHGRLLKDGELTPDGYVVNDVFTRNGPHPPRTPPDQLMPALTMPTIGDRLSEKGVSWAWYSQGWTRMLAGNAPKLFNYEHQVFVYFAGYGEGKPGWRHLKDETDFLEALKGPALPAVCFIKPTDRYDMHPGLGTVVDGERQVMEVVSAVQRSPYWRDSAIVITYDENGGRWDHVAPPVIDRWGPGARVPALVISPLAKRGHIEHTQYETVSILRTIERRWGLRPLSDRDARARDMAACFR